jgi:hypothetical protein
MAESILFRTEVGRPLTYTEIDNNFKYVSNPWSPGRVYTTGMIIYHDIVPNKYILYRANKTTTEGTFDLTEWDAMNSNVITVIITPEDSLADYIANEWQPDDIKIGDYVVTSKEAVFLLYQNNGGSESDYILLNAGNISTIANVIISAESTLTDYIVNEWDGEIQPGDIVILATNDVYMLTNGDGSLITQYIQLNATSVNWGDIVGRPSSTPSQIDNSVNNSHAQNTDQYLDFGGANQISTADIYSHVNDSSIHFTMSSISIDHEVNLTNVGTYTHTDIDDHINDSDIHIAPANLDHDLLLNSGTYTHAQLDLHVDGAVYSHADIDTHLGAGTYTHGDIDTHINDAAIHYLETDIDHNNLQNIGSFSHPQIDDHINDASIHLGGGGGSIDHFDLDNIGVNTHVDIDNHISNAAAHFEMNEIDHSVLIGTGFYIHYEIDGHIDDTSIHYTLDEIDHVNISGIGAYSHPEIDDFINNIDTTIESHINIPLEGGTGANSVMMLNNNAVAGDNSLAFGSNLTNNAADAAIVGGSLNVLDSSAVNSVILGGNGITGIQPNTVYVPNLDIVSGKLKLGKTDILNWFGQTTNSATVEIFLLDSTRYTIPVGSSIMFRLDVAAYNGSDDVSKIWELRGGIRHETGGTLSLIGNSVSSFMVSEDGLYDLTFDTTNWLVSVSPDNINKSLKISVTGEDTKTISWSVTGFITLVN